MLGAIWWLTVFGRPQKQNTYIIWQGSFLSFKQCPFSHFFLVGNEVFTYFEPACVLLTPHQGASVSIINFSLGIDFKTSKLASVFSELKKDINV